MKQRVLLVAALALLAPSLGTAGAEERNARPDPCGHLNAIAFDNARICTHGPDAAPTSGDIAIANAMFANPGAPAPCVKRASESDYTSGPRIRVMYGVPSDRTPSPSNRSLIPGWLAQGADKLRASGAVVDGEYQGQDYRMYCVGSPPAVEIVDVTLDPVGPDGQFTYGDLASSLDRLGYTNDNHDYAVFVDQLGGAYPYGGQGSIYGDTNPDPALNYNNSASLNKLSLVKLEPGWGDYPAQVFMHEVGHNLGAVQNNAPHASGGWHCYDEYDTMCYSDGGSYFNNGGTLQFLCTPDDGATSIWDCGRDDYYNVSRATVNTSGSYLERNWNLARSSWFTPVPIAGGGAPLVTAPTYAFGTGAVSGGTATTKTIPVEIRWNATDPQGIASTQLQMQTDGGAWVNVAVGATAKTVKKPLLFGHTHNFQVRATDSAGNTSAYAVGTPFDLGKAQESEGVTYNGIWKSASNTNYLGGAARYTTARNASSFLSFTGRAVAWIGAKGTTYGSATVTMDGVSVSTKSQNASATKYRNIIHRYSWTTTGLHSIQISCQASTGHPKCDVDAFALMI